MLEKLHLGVDFFFFFFNLLHLALGKVRASKIERKAQNPSPSPTSQPERKNQVLLGAGWLGLDSGLDLGVTGRERPGLLERRREATVPESPFGGQGPGRLSSLVPPACAPPFSLCSFLPSGLSGPSVRHRSSQTP